MGGNNYKANMAFEDEVRRVAEAVWNLPAGECQPDFYSGNKQVSEIDGIARLRDTTHLIMATTSTRLDKAKNDVKKLDAAEQVEKVKAPSVCKWLITEQQLNGEHIAYARRSNVTVLTLQQFRDRFFNAHRYISLREKHQFGSARDPLTDSVQIGENVYVPLPMFAQTLTPLPDGKVSEREELQVTIADIRDMLEANQTVVMTAPFGSGKSLTTREVFKLLAADKRRDRTTFAPIALNLREHWGQTYCDEILDRHARAIGYSARDELVIAWRASMTCLLLDGFDEVASQAITRRDDQQFMRNARRDALKGLRSFTGALPGQIGIFICGRNHYFDNRSELLSALGLENREVTLVRLEEFNEDGAQQFLRRNGFHQELPSWIPRKPLILAYLLRRRLFEEILTIDATKGFGFAWDSFLNSITQREANLGESVMEATTLRHVMERLASLVRGRASGIGPITGNDLAEAYLQETNQPAGEAVLAQLQRLPGLAQREPDPSARSFVDDDMLAALQGSGFARLVLGDYANETTVPLDGLSQKALDMASYLLHKHGAKAETVIAVAERYSNDVYTRPFAPQRVADTAMVALSMASYDEHDSLDYHSLTVQSASMHRLDIEEITVNNLVLRDCLIGEISLGPGGASGSILFERCTIEKVAGAANAAGLPSGMFKDCEVNSYDNLSTNSALQQLPIDSQMKALLTILRKLYKQAGGGRRKGSFFRGVSQDVQGHVNTVLQLLERDGLITLTGDIVHPIRKFSGRVERILNAPLLSQDPLMLQVKRL